jgi:transcriptional regulator with XRE-family HTH domain
MKTPNYIDRHVGSRLRTIRIKRNMAPKALAQAIDVTVERLADLEEGRERVGADLMRKLSRILQAPPSEFFVGLSRGAAAAPTAPAEASPEDQEKQLLKDFARIRDARSRTLILSLVAAYAEFGDLEDQ